MPELIWGFLKSVSKALDLSYSGILSHHRRVAVLASKIARSLGLPEAKIALTTGSALIHDLGIRTWGDRARVHKFEVDYPYEHAVDGYRILTGGGAGKPLRTAGIRAGGEGETTTTTTTTTTTAAEPDAGGEGRGFLLAHARVILHHHDKWEGGNPSQACRDQIPIESRIVHLADRLDVLLDPAKPFNYQKREIFEVLETRRGREFDPALIDVLHDLARSDSFWFDLEPDFLAKTVEACLPGRLGARAGRDAPATEEIEARSGEIVARVSVSAEPSLQRSSLTDILEVLARVFAEVVDRRSPYTRQHSQSVGECAFILGKHLGFDELTCRELRVAGLLHDLGKLGVSETILDKKAALTEEEMCIVKRHPYLTYQLLDEVPGFDRIRDWASFHHERLDGRGYPFGLDSSSLSTEARVIAICDVFSALSDDRPYRPGLPREQVQSILVSMAESGALDREIVDLAGRAL